MALRMKLRHHLQKALDTQRVWRGLLWVLMLVICWLAFSPAPPAQLHTHWDKLNHLLAFAALAWCAALGWPARPGAPVLPQIARWVLGLMVFGLFIEAVQSQLPARSAELADLGADALGVALGGLLAGLLRSASRAVGR